MNQQQPPMQTGAQPPMQTGAQQATSPSYWQTINPLAGRDSRIAARAARAASQGIAAQAAATEKIKASVKPLVDNYNKKKAECLQQQQQLKKNIETSLANVGMSLQDEKLPEMTTPAQILESGAQAPVQGNVALAPGVIESQPQGPPAPNPAVPLNTNSQQAAAPLTDVQGNPDVVLKAKLSEYFQQQGVVDINGKSLDPEMIGRGISDLKFNDTNGFKSKFYINEAASQYKTAEQIIAEPELLNQIKTNALEIANGGMSTSLRGQGVSWGGKRKSKKSQKKQAKRKTCSGGKKNKSKKKNCSGGNKNKSKKQNCNGGKKSQRRQKK